MRRPLTHLDSVGPSSCDRQGGKVSVSWFTAVICAKGCCLCSDMKEPVTSHVFRMSRLASIRGAHH